MYFVELLPAPAGRGGKFGAGIESLRDAALLMLL